MKACLWLAWRELVTRKSAFVTGLGLVSVAVAFCAATELLSRSRDVAVAAQIDHIGPALRLIPAEKTVYDLARFDLGTDSFTIEDAARIRSTLSPWIRALEARLLAKVQLEGQAVPAIGVDPRRVISPFEALGRLGDSDVILGTHLAHRLGRSVGSEVSINGSGFRIAGILPETASAEDLAVYLTLGRLGALLERPGATNEIRVFPATSTSIEEIVAQIESRHREAAVINTYRGDTAEHEISNTLVRHRRVLYVITALVVALSIFIWSYLNADERTLEMATVVTLGGTARTVLTMLVVRAAVVGFLGGLIGYLAGASVALARDFEYALGVVLSWKLVLLVSGGAVAVCAFGAITASIPVLFREPTIMLHER